MKKIFIAITALTMSVSAVFSQTNNDAASAMKLGFKIGANVSNVYDTQGDQFNANPKLGLAGGVFLFVPVGSFLGVQPEILFSQKGYQSSGTVLGVDYKYTHTSNHIDVPILFAFKPVPELKILLGPQYSFLISEKNEFTNTLFTNPLIKQTDFDNSNVRKNTLGFVFGGDLSLGRFVVGLRTGWDVINNNGDGTTTVPRYKNMYYQGTVGFVL
jgi:Outer membrane protein beta-barrel domain